MLYLKYERDDYMKLLEKAKIVLTDITKQLTMIFLYFIIPSLFNSIPIFKKNLNESSELYNLAYFTIYIVIITLFISLYRKRIIPDFYDFLKKFKKYIKDNWHYYVIGLSLMILLNAIIGLFLGLPENEIAIRTVFKNSPFTYTLIIIIFGPIIEEIMTRAPLKNTFNCKIIYYILSALVFGLLHVIDYIDTNNLLGLFHILPYATLGFSFAIIYDKSNNIWTNIFFHSLHNTITILLLVIAGGLL